LIGSVFGLSVMTYSGFFLSTAFGNLFWLSPILPFLFILSGFGGGVAAAGLLTPATALAGDYGKVIAGLHSSVDRIHPFELFMLIGYLGHAGLLAPLNFYELVAGGFASLFWIVVLVIGYFIPMAMGVYVRRLERTGAFRRAIPLMAISFFLTLFGSLVMKTTIVMVGQL